MGITFGDEAQVEVGGDMVGGHKITVDESAWNAVAAAIANARVSADSQADAMQNLSAIREELKKEEPNPDTVKRFALGIKSLVPHAFTLLLAVAPELVKLAPSLLR